MKAWASFMYRRRWLVIGLWVAGFIALQVASGVAGKAYHDKFSLPNTDSTRAFDILQKDFPSNANSSMQVVFRAREGKLTDPANAKLVEATLATVAKQPHVTVVSDPLTKAGAAQLSRDRTIAYSDVVFDADDDNIGGEIDAVTNVVDKVLAKDSPAVQVEAGGQLVDQATQSGGGPSTGLGFLAAALILAVTFGTLVATAVPLVTTAIALASGLAIDGLLSHTMTIAQFTPDLASLIGLGVGIDYALFLVSRYRTELRNGASVEAAVVKAVDTSGRAVTFAGITVCIALLGMLVLGVNFLVGVAVASSVAVAVTMFASVTFLPALLSVLGTHLDLGWLRRLPGDTGYRPTLGQVWVAGLRARRAGAIAAAAVVAVLVVLAVVAGAPGGAVAILLFFAVVEGWERLLPRMRQRRGEARPSTGPTRWERWAALIQRHPVTAVVTGVVIVTLLALPALELRLAFSDAGTNNKDKTTRQAYDILGKGFGRGSNGPFLVTSTLAQKSDAAALPQLRSALATTPGVTFVSPPKISKGGRSAVITLIPDGGPQDKATSQLLTELRTDVVPQATQGTGLRTYIGGNTAGATDFSDVLNGKLPYFIGVVVLLSMLLLVLAFRTIVVPVKAAVMNLLSVAAALGVVTAVFQHGWGASLIGVSGTGPIEPFIPVIMFAVLFGLSMDYEVFLVSRIHEEWIHSRDNGKAVLRGLGTTAGVITAAATIMIAVFGAFILLPDRVIKIFGVGLASAIFIDAFVIRTLLVPGVMFLLGKWNWYLPAWLDRVVPQVSIEGEYEAPADDSDLLAGARV